MPISINNAVRHADHAQVIQAAATLWSANPAWPAVPATSQLLNNRIGSLINANFDTIPAPPILIELKNYLALSNLAHLFDGWRYLSQSSLAVFRGARREGIHLAYYAELRAAMSILAGSGISISNGKNYSLDNAGNVLWFNGRTHEATWDAIKIWSQQPDNANAILRSLRAFGINGLDWLEACRATSSADAITEQWLQSWSLDLRQLRNDSALRNNSSYEVDTNPNAHDPFQQVDLQLLIDAGHAFSPGAIDTRDSIDAAIIFNLCETAMQVTGKTRKLFWSDLKDNIATLHGITREESGRRVNILMRSKSGKAANIINKCSPSNKEFSGVFSRALLLLKLAASLKQDKWSSVQQIAPTGSRDWQSHAARKYGASSYLWDPAHVPDDFKDLEKDYEEIFDEIEKWFTENGEFKFYSIWRELPSEMIGLTQMERFLIWTIAI